MELLVLILACLGAHRLWNYEDVFASVRMYLRFWPRLMKPILCPACNAFWIAFLLSTIQYTAAHFRIVGIVMFALAAYPLLRASVWVYANIDDLMARKTIVALSPKTSPASTPAAEPISPEKAKRIAAHAAETELMARVRAGEAKSKPGCPSCTTKKETIVTQQAEALSYDKRVVLLTALNSFPSSYSLVSAIFDQARMLARNPRWLVQVWVMEGTDLRLAPVNLPDNVQVRAIVPHSRWTEDVVDEDIVDRLSVAIRDNLMVLGNATIITHDLLFISHYISFAVAIHRIGGMTAFAWLHVCHSAAAVKRPEGEARRYRATLPDKHRLLCLNANDAEHLATYYDVPVSQVSVAPNARDITTFGKMEPHAAALIAKHELALANIVQIFPVSGTRMEAKGVRTLISIFGKLASNGVTAKLVLVNAHSNSPAVEALLDSYKILAATNGLGGDNLIVTSHEFAGSKADGLPEQAVRDLFQVSNLFVFPSISEASSLVLLEAAISGCLIVTNESLHTLDGFVRSAITAPFGSVRHPGDTSDHGALAKLILHALAADPMNQSKRDALARYSHHTVADQITAAIEATAPV